MTTDALNQVLASVQTKLSEAWGLPTEQVEIFLAGHDREYYAKMRTAEGSLIGMYHFSLREHNGAPLVVMNSYKPGNLLYTTGWSAVAKVNEDESDIEESLTDFGRFAQRIGQMDREELVSFAKDELGIAIEHWVRTPRTAADLRSNLIRIAERMFDAQTGARR